MIYKFYRDLNSAEKTIAESIIRGFPIEGIYWVGDDQVKAAFRDEAEENLYAQGVEVGLDDLSVRMTAKDLPA